MDAELKDKVDVLVYNARNTVPNMKYRMMQLAGWLPEPQPREVESLLDLIET